eukprot:2457678-Pyramimonas_sp.AAC.1
MSFGIHLVSQEIQWMSEGLRLLSIWVPIDVLRDPMGPHRIPMGFRTDPMDCLSVPIVSWNPMGSLSVPMDAHAVSMGGLRNPLGFLRDP